MAHSHCVLSLAALSAQTNACFSNPSSSFLAIKYPEASECSLHHDNNQNQTPN
jgi:hypothetical protein